MCNSLINDCSEHFKTYLFIDSSLFSSTNACSWLLPIFKNAVVFFLLTHKGSLYFVDCDPLLYVLKITSPSL